MATANSASSPTSWSGAASGYASIAVIPGAVSIEAARLLLENYDGGDISFMDVAAGPGTLAAEVFKLLKEHTRGRAIITDFAQGMVDAARAKVDAARAASQVPAGLEVEFAKADGCDLSAYKDGSITHAGVMFGIMFYSDVAKGLKELRRVMAPGGVAAIGCWHKAGAAELVNDFASFLGLPPASADPASPAAAADRIIKIGSDADGLATDLRAAGFAAVKVHTVSLMFRSPDIQGFLTMVRSNPAMKMALAAAPADTDWEGKWASFLASGTPGAAKWITANTDEAGASQPILTIPFIANVAIATA